MAAKRARAALDIVVSISLLDAVELALAALEPILCVRELHYSQRSNGVS